MIDQLIEQQLQPTIVDQVLAAMASGNALAGVHVGLESNGQIRYEFSVEATRA